MYDPVMGWHRRVSAFTLVLTVIAVATVTAGPPWTLPPGLSPDEYARLRELTERATITGRVDGATFRLREGVFEYLLDHPELAARVSQALGVGTYRVWRDADEMWIDDGRGAVGRFSIVHAAPGRRIVHVRGSYKIRYLPAIHGEALAVLEYEGRPAPENTTLITPTVTGFVRLDNVVVDALSRLMSETARAKAERFAHRIVHDFAVAAEKIEANRGRAVEELRRRPGVASREVDELTRLLGLVSQ